MGKASSNKKVARAASTSGGRTAGGRTPWAYYIAIAVVVVLGTATVYFSRSSRLSSTLNVGPTPPVVGVDHWHEAYAFYVCNSDTKGQFVPPFPYRTTDSGILTLGGGVIDIHPYQKSAAGKNAQLGVFTSGMGATVNAGELKIPSFPGYSGHLYRDSDNCGGKPGRVQVLTFPSATGTGKLSTLDPRSVPLKDQTMVVIAFMPKGTTIPPPPQDVINAMLHPTDVASTATPTPTTTTLPGATTTTLPGATTTTAPAATTTVPAVTTTTAAATTTTAAK